MPAKNVYHYVVSTLPDASIRVDIFKGNNIGTPVAWNRFGSHQTAEIWAKDTTAMYASNAGKVA